MQHALLIVNPHSRNGQADALKEAVRMLQASGIEVSVYESESESDMISEIEKYHPDDGIVIIAGGDGTISAALEPIYKKKHTLAILPLGTANDLARSIGVPHQLAEATQIIIADKRERINLGKVNNEYFVNVAHIGLGVDVTHELTTEVKKYFGVFAYLGAFMKAVKRNRSFGVQIQSDDWNCFIRATHLAIGNGRFYGGGNIVDDQSTVLDGELHLFCIKAQRWWQLLLLGPSLRSGTVKSAERVVCRTARKFSVKTSKPREVEADGDSKTNTPAEFEVIPQAIEIIVGDMPMPNREKV